MRTYRAGWRLAVNVVAALSLAMVWVKESPWLVLGEVMVVGAMGMALGATWEDDRARRWRVGRTWALWGIVTALVLVGLPHLVGGWSLLVLVVLGALSPAVLGVVPRPGRARWEPATGDALSGLSGDELARRWRSSASALRNPGRTSSEVLLIVADRQRLLDEMEARDPEGFARWLVAAGWRESRAEG